MSFVVFYCFGYFINLFRKKYYKTNPTLFQFFSFVLITILILSFARIDCGLGSIFLTRYRIYSVLFLILAYVSILETTPIKKLHRIFPAIFILSIIFNVFSYKNSVVQVVAHKNRVIMNMNQWRNTGVFPTYPGSKQNFTLLLESSIRQNLISSR